MGTNSDSSTWKCPSCGELSEPQFDACWQCGTDAPADLSLAEYASNEIGELLPMPSDAEKSSQPLRCRLGRRIDKLSCWIRQQPSWLIASELSLLAIGVSLIYYGTSDTSGSEFHFSCLGVSLFLPGAIRSGRLPLMFVAALFGAVAPFVASWAVSLATTSVSPTAIDMLWAIGLITFAGVSAWLFSSDDSLRQLLWTAGSCMIAATIFATGLSLLVQSVWLGWLSYTVAYLTMPVFAWLVIDLSFWLPQRTDRWPKAVAAIAGIAMLVFSSWMMFDGIFALARASLRGDGPLSKRHAVYLLANRGKEEDYEFLFQQLAEADWVQRDQILHDAPFETSYMWRDAAIKQLIRRDRRRATEELLQVFLANPEPNLFDEVGELFVEARKYEIVPYLMRRAMADSINPSIFAFVGSNRSKKQLQKLGIPQVGTAWLKDAEYLNILFEVHRARDEGREHDFNFEFTISTDARECLTELLGADAGPYLQDWKGFYNERFHELPTPLSKELEAETERVIWCYEQYEVANDAWFTFAKEIEAQTGSRPQQPEEPNWKVRTTAELEQEVKRYVQAVGAAGATDLSTDSI